MSNNKQIMKLYTEKEIKRLLKEQIIFDDEDFDKLTPIELPSDEEIYDESILVNQNITIFNFDKVSFQYGAKWMRNLIQGGNK